MKKSLLLVLLLLFLLVSSGCETMGGFGRDVQKAGDWVEKKAQ